jgi:hypothetical protein
MFGIDWIFSESLAWWISLGWAQPENERQLTQAMGRSIPPAFSV